jgi:hypothetical protein
MTAGWAQRWKFMLTSSALLKSPQPRVSFSTDFFSRSVGTRHEPHFDSKDPNQARTPATFVGITPFDAVKRRTMSGHGMAAETILTTRQCKIEYRFRAPVHLLVVFEEASREEGESFVEDLPRSSLRALTRKITFVPAGYEYHEWHQPRALSRMILFYLDPARVDDVSEAGLAGRSFTPRLFFENDALWD